MLSDKPASTPNSLTVSQLGVLHQREIAVIEAALKKVGAFGEVHLVIERGRIRFVRTIRSEAIEDSPC